MVTWEQRLVKQGGRDRRVEQGGNRDEWRGVGDGMEIRQRWVGEGDFAGVTENGAEWSCWRSISDPVSNTYRVLVSSRVSSEQRLSLQYLI